MTQKPYHPPHTLIDKSAEELSTLEEAGEISEKDSLGARWRGALIKQGLASAFGGQEMERYRKMKEQQKAAEAETQTK